MNHKIHPSLLSMAVSVDDLLPLEGNPRVGNVDAIMASYEEFGQVKPIVARKNDDGTATVIAGNHQLEAAKELGWESIAVVFLDADDRRAIAYAIADNRTMELGYTEPELLTEMLLDVSDFYPELMEGLGWDEFEIASLESGAMIEDSRSSISEIEEQKYSEQISHERSQANDSIKSMVETNQDGESRITARSDMDQNDIAIRGSTVAVPGAAPQAAVQYTIVFDNIDQQSIWYKFIKWIKSDPETDGSTTAEKLISFIDARMP
jgi:ParB-like chromosome segregation protein Spo0J